MFKLYFLIVTSLSIVYLLYLIYLKWSITHEKYLESFLALAFGALVWSIGIETILITDYRSLLYKVGFMMFMIGPALSSYYILRFSIEYVYTKSLGYITVTSTMAKMAAYLIMPYAAYYTFIDPITSVYKKGSTNYIKLNNPAAYFIYALFFLSTFLASYIILYVKLREQTDYMKRKQLRLSFSAVTITSSLAMVTNLSLPIATKALQTVWLGPIFTLIFIYLVTYGVIRYRLFDIKSSAFRAVGYTFALLSIGFISTLVVLRIILPIVGQGSDYDPQVYVVTFLAVIFVSWVTPKFRKFFDRITYKIFYRNSYDPLLFAGQISAVVTSNPKTTDLQKGLLKLYHKAFGSQYIQIIVNHAEDEAFNQKQLEIGQTLGVGAPSEVLKFYERLFIGHEHKNKFVLRSKIDFEEGSEEARLLDQHSIGMIAKLKLNRRIVGYLVFGDKTSGTLYTLEDIALITGHYSEVAIALQNSTRYNRIAAFNLELQEKIEIATFKLKKSNARLRKLDKAKDDFLSIASHQLRTPLTVVRGNIDLVANGDLGPITEDAKGVLIQSERSAGRLSDLINDFLSTSRLKTGKFILTPAPVNLKFTVEQQIEQLIDFAAQRGIELTLHKVDDNLPVINADEEKLRQVMLNTIDNAIYYSARHSGKVDVALYNDGKNIVYKVKDNGIGVPANEKSKMFTRMYRADNAKNARPDGNGLGLFLMKKIIDAHHGEIIFESEEGKGSTFGFKLALNPKVELTKQAIT